MQAERVRFTISVPEDVHQAFAGLAEASGVSLSRCVGDWLRDTAEAAHITTVKLAEVRRSPQEAFQAFIRDGVAPEVVRLMERARNDPKGLGAAARGGIQLAGAGASRGASIPPALSPPSSNTGGKVPQDNRKRPGKKGSGGRVS